MTTCACGCGGTPPIAKKTRTSLGHVKGERVNYVRGHGPSRKGIPLSAAHRRSLSEAKKGKPQPQRQGSLNPMWRGAEAGYQSIHTFVRRYFTKTGECETCGKQAKTQWAFRHHPAKHTRDRGDYMELCPKCHSDYDRGRRS